MDKMPCSRCKQPMFHFSLETVERVDERHVLIDKSIRHTCGNCGVEVTIKVPAICFTVLLEQKKEAKK